MTLLSEKDNLFHIDESKIHGKGIFSNKFIKEGTIIGIAFKKVNSNSISINDYIRTELGAYINHGDNSNIKLVVDENLNFVYKTLRDIQIGEELTSNYNKFPWIGTKNFKNIKESSEHLSEYTLFELGVAIVIVSITTILVKVAKKLTSNERKACSPIKDSKERKDCTKKFKNKSIEIQIDIIDTNMKLCDKTNNPEKCKQKLEQLKQKLKQKEK